MPVSARAFTREYQHPDETGQVTATSDYYSLGKTLDVLQQVNLNPPGVFTPARVCNVTQISHGDGGDNDACCFARDNRDL